MLWREDHAYNCSDQVNEDDEAHGEAAKSTEVREEDELAEVVNGGVDPSSSLGQQDFELVWCDGMRYCIGCELHLERREMLHHNGRQITIFTKVQQILLVKGIDDSFRIVIDHPAGYDERPSFVCCTNPVH